MGNCCQKTESQSKIAYSTRTMLGHEVFSGMNFYFSTQSLSRLQGQCLVIFSDKKLKLKKSKILQKLNKHQSKKINEYTLAYLQNNHISYEKKYLTKSQLKQEQTNSSENNNKEFSQYLIFDIQINTVRFTKVAIVFVQPWQGKKDIKHQIQKRFCCVLEQLQKQNITSLVIAQFDEDLGIPVNIGSGSIARSLYFFKTQFKTVTISCRNSSDQIEYQNIFRNFKEDLTVSTFSRKSISNSVYF